MGQLGLISELGCLKTVHRSENHMPGRYWTIEEDRQLRMLLAAGLEAEEIALRLDRKNRTAIYSRIQRLARRPPTRLLKIAGVAQW
jgi:hypothetical protein